MEDTPRKRPRRAQIANFGAGPGTLHPAVLAELAQQIEDYEGSGVSLLEMSHRTSMGPVQSTLVSASSAVRKLLKVPDSYEVLWMQGGGHGQFSAVPLNLLGNKKSADFVDTGIWTHRAMDEASKYCQVRIAARTEDNARIPPVSSWDLSDDSAYVHICLNDTISGLEFLDDPDIGDKLLVADCTSTLLSRPVRVERYAALYCASGKNLGPAGVCLLIVRRSVLGRARPDTPMVLNWQLAAETSPVPCLVNTPPVFAVWACKLVLDQMLKDFGDMDVVEQRVRRRAAKIYDVIDRSSGFYVNVIEGKFRSQTTLCFTFGADKDFKREWDGSITSKVQKTELEEKFTEQAGADGMMELQGHPAFGGIRVCLYNALADEAVDRLVTFMEAFHQKHGPA